MSTLNYIDENGHINKVGVIPQNVIDDVTELKDKTTWKFLGNKGLQIPLSLPTNFEELYVIYGRSSSATSDVGAIVIPKLAIANSGNTIRNIIIGMAYQNSKLYCYQGKIIISNGSSIYLQSSYYVGTDGTQDVGSTSNIWVYYR